VLAFLQNKEMMEGHLPNSFPMLGILFVDFFNFYNSLELLKIEIRPKLPSDFSNQLVIFPKESLESFIQIRGDAD